MNSINLEHICINVCELAKEVGSFIKEEQKKVSATDIETKSINSLVSYVDKTAEQKIVTVLKTLLPEAGFITEENTIAENKKDFTWIVDPLDGTTNFLHGLPCYSISIGLMHEEKMVLGVVYEINLDECFYAWGNSQAYLNKQIIQVSKTSLLKNSLIATGFPYYDYEQMDSYMNLFKHLMYHSRGLRRIGSAAVDLAYLACGRFDVFYEYSLQPWDVAAGTFIVQQAGGKVSDFKGGYNYIFGKELISSNSLLHQEFSDNVKIYFK